jgi:hypothetical protein
MTTIIVFVSSLLVSAMLVLIKAIELKFYFNFIFRIIQQLFLLHQKKIPGIEEGASFFL